MMRSLVVGCAVSCMACGPAIERADGSGDASDGASSTGRASSSTTGASTRGNATATVEPADSGEGSEDSNGVTFIDCGGAAPPGTSHHCIGPAPDCSILDQNCPEGEKCSPWSLDGGPDWNATRCVPIAPDAGGVGDPCTATGDAYSGIDDCGRGQWCAVEELGTLQGVCWPLCHTGPADEVACDEGACSGSLDPELPICVQDCDPIAPDCARGRCDHDDGRFACLPAVGPSVPSGQGCAAAGACEPGSACVVAARVPGCVDASCCAPLCDRLAPDPDAGCPGGTSCAGFFEPAVPPAGYEHVGVCGPA